MPQLGNQTLFVHGVGGNKVSRDAVCSRIDVFVVGSEVAQGRD